MSLEKRLSKLEKQAWRSLANEKYYSDAMFFAKKRDCDSFLGPVRASVRFQSSSLRASVVVHISRDRATSGIYVFMEQCFLPARKLDSKLARCRALFITFVPAARSSVGLSQEKICHAGPKIASFFSAP